MVTLPANWSRTYGVVGNGESVIGRPRNSPTLLRTVPSPTSTASLAPRLGFASHPKLQSLLSHEQAKPRTVTDFKCGRYIHRVHPNKSPLKIFQKREHGRIQGLWTAQVFFFGGGGTPYYFRNGWWSHGLQIWQIHSQQYIRTKALLLICLFLLRFFFTFCVVRACTTSY